MAKWYERVGGALATGNPLGAFAPEIASGISDYFMGPSRAGKAQARAADKSLEAQERMFDKSMEAQRPWLEAGQRVLSDLEREVESGGFDVDPGVFQYGDYSGLGPYDSKDFQGEFKEPEFIAPEDFKAGTFEAPGKFERDKFQFDFKEVPGYQFRLDEAMKATKRGAAKMGGFASGATLSEMGDRAGQMASQEYGQAYNRARSAYEGDTARDYQQYSDDYARGYGRFQDEESRRYGQFADKTARDYQQYSDDYARGYGRFQDEYNMFAQKEARDYGRHTAAEARDYGRYADDRSMAYGQFADDYNRQLMQQGNRYNRMAGLAGIGQTAAGNVSNLSMQQGQNLAGAYGNIGNAQANRYMGMQNTLNPFINMAAQGAAAYYGGR